MEEICKSGYECGFPICNLTLRLLVDAVVVVDKQVENACVTVLCGQFGQGWYSVVETLYLCSICRKRG
jgi:hypothetical protein